MAVFWGGGGISSIFFEVTLYILTPLTPSIKPPPMSCAPVDEIGASCHTMQKCAGFLFAFYNYSQVPQTTWMEKFVHVVTGSDSIHVAVLPVPNCILKVPSSPFQKYVSQGKNEVEVHKLQVEDRTFTAFMFSGYEIQKASSVLNDKYEYIFLPVDETNKYINGINFLQSLGGSGYNYLGLPLTVLPKALKPPVRNSEFNSHCAPSKVFCSQVGLMLLYRCGLLPDSGIDPSSCNPGDLHKILTLLAGGLSCRRECIEISDFALQEPAICYQRPKNNALGDKRVGGGGKEYVILPRFGRQHFISCSGNNNNNNNNNNYFSNMQ